ncbi:hypothetical protein ZHAS_00007495 [Anopheles sinensis]|uniref:Uncharacterized protein n=1 Tax=Anopheles sinensis TaxID=74873 RepID=A0A084VPX2_ANOSI|nr:hypothetical protein ZHAS_00007495 [Anopheles sinensis]
METVCLSTARSSSATMRLHRLRSVLESSVAWRMLLVTVLLCGLPRSVTGYFDLFLNHSEMIKLMEETVSKLFPNYNYAYVRFEQYFTCVVKRNEIKSFGEQTR